MKYELQNTYTQLVSGILTRTLYDTPSGDGYQVAKSGICWLGLDSAARVSLWGAPIFDVFLIRKVIEMPCRVNIGHLPPLANLAVALFSNALPGGTRPERALVFLGQRRDGSGQ